MFDLNFQPALSASPLIGDRPKAMKLLAIMIFGRVLRDVIVPEGNQVGRSIYAGFLAAGILFVLARPAVPRLRAGIWAVLGGITIAGIVAS